MLKKLYYILYVRNYRSSIIRYLIPKRYRLSNSSIVQKHRLFDSKYLLIKIKSRNMSKHRPHNNEDLKSLLVAATKTGL